jgi:tetratricopeptide (TPR) repeat protein
MRAAETAKDDANVLWMAAFATFRLDMNAQAAKELADRSLRLNPNSAIALAISGWIEANLGNPKKAIEALVQAERLSPRDPRGWFFSAGLSISYFIAADYENSAAAAKRALVQNPRFTTSLRTLAASLAQLGRIEEARASAKQVLAIEPGFTISGHRARLGFFREELWDRFSTGMRLAGLPD